VRFPKADTVNLRLVENKTLTQRTRLAALQAIGRVPLSVLLRILRDPSSPSRLLGLAAKRYAIENLRRELRLRDKRRTEKATAGPD
jgi:hypothetical protein